MKTKEIIKKFSQAHWIFIFIALVFGAILISFTPPLWGADEGAHFFRAYQVSEGRFFQDKQNINGKESYGGFVPASFNRLKDLSYIDLVDGQSGEKKQVDDISKYFEIGKAKINDDKKVPNPFRAIIYPTITYAAPALGMAIANPFSPTALSLLYSARVATLLLYVLLVFSSIFLLRNSSVKWIVFVVALLPTALYQASVVSADSLLLALSLLFFSITYRVIHEDRKLDRRFIILMLMVSCLLTLIKPPYIILILPLIFLPLNKVIAKKDKRLIRIFIPIVCVIIAAFAIVSAKNLTAAEPLQHIGLAGQLNWIVSHPLSYFYMLINSITVLDWVPPAIGIFGASFVFVPRPTIEVLLVLLAFSAYVRTSNINEDEEKIKHIKLTGLLFLTSSILTCLAVITVLYLTWTPIGAELVAGVQGRYFLPVVGFVLLGLRMLTSARLVVTERNTKIIFASVIVLSLLSSVLWYHRMLY